MATANKHYYTFMIDPDLARELKRVKARDGVAESEQIRRALRKWFAMSAPSVQGRASASIGGRRVSAKRKR